MAALLADAGQAIERLVLRSLEAKLKVLGAAPSPRPRPPDGLTHREIEIADVAEEAAHQHHDHQLPASDRHVG
jgi:hypothetical protein